MIQTPMFEYYDMYDVTSPIHAEDMFKFFDADGRMLALRPDITTSVARIAGAKNIGKICRLGYFIAAALLETKRTLASETA